MTSPFKVLFVSSAGGGTRQCRCFQPAEELELAGVTTGFRVGGDPQLLRDVLDYDVFILHRVPHSPLIADLIDLAHRQGKLVLFESDDLVFDPDLLHHDSFFRELPPQLHIKHRHDVAGNQLTLLASDGALTTTEYLASQLRRFKEPVHINRNALGVEFVRRADAFMQAGIHRDPAKVVIGYISGSKSHNDDFKVVSEPLYQVLKRHPEAILRVVGHLELTPNLTSLGRQVDVVPFIPWEEIPRAIGEMDINLAPLEEDNPYCQSKSELKYIEASYLGVPLIASATECFRYAVRHGENGLLASTAEEWREAIEGLVGDAAMREAIGEAARQDVLQHYSPAVRGQQFKSLLEGIRSAHPPTTGPAVDERSMTRLVIDRLVGYLSEEEAYDLRDPDAPNRGIMRRREIEKKNRDRLIGEVRQARRSPRARLANALKRAVKAVSGRRYVMRMAGTRYQALDELPSGQAYRQDFQATADHLSGVAVLFATYRRLNTSDVVFRLFELNRPDDPLAYTMVSASVVEDNAFFAFPFDPIPTSDGHSYFWTIESPDADAGDAVGLWRQLDGVGPEETYRVGDHDRPGRLAFTVQYRPPVSRD